ncbi:Mitogen-activated protein kinase kinase kinase [Sergentomyia squamirostris]
MNQTPTTGKIPVERIFDSDVPAEDLKVPSSNIGSSKIPHERQYYELNAANSYSSTVYEKKERQTLVSRNISVERIWDSDVPAEDLKITSSNIGSYKIPQERQYDEVNAANSYGSTGYKPLSCLKGNTENIQNKIKLSESLTTLCETYKFPERQLKFKKILGSGFFGEVRHAIAFGLVPEEDETPVAVKVFRSDYKNREKSILAEIEVLSHIGSHPNVVKLLGIVVRDISTAEFMIMMEYCNFGNLLDIVQKYKNNFINEIDHLSERITSIVPESSYSSLTTTKLFSWSHQIASGMVFLSNSRIIHGDLASRNILLCERNLVKICDFGLSKIKSESNYYINPHRTAPWKWVAQESLREGIFSTYTDVWSYGVVLWEIFSLGNEPYQGIGLDTLFVQLSSGLRLGKPNFTTEDLYIIMRRCWHVNPRSRPSFAELEQEIGKIILREHLFTEINELT